MKLNSKISFGLIFLGALVWAGCQTTQYPTTYISSTGPNPAMIVDFESGLQVNPALAEAGKPGNKVQVAGTIVGTGSPFVTPVLVTPGAANTSTCVHMAGTVVDLANGNYPAVEFVIPLESGGNGQYNASLFTGIKFYLKVAASDTASTRSFSIPIVKTSTAPAGTCALYNTCYNGFSYAYGSTGGNWQLVSLPFASLTRGNYGGSITPPTLSGANLKEFLSLQWSEGNNNVMGTVNVDFSVDEIQFF